MCIKLPDNLPARQILESEGVKVVDQTDEAHGSQRPLRIALLNLMPKKPVTEAQLARLLGGTPYPVDLTLFIPDTYHPKTTPAPHISRYYRRWSQVRDRNFDGLIVTGAPVETLPFEAVDYWRELTEIFDWAKSHATRTFYICWAAQAALYHFHGVPKHALHEKKFGVFQHRIVEGRSALLSGFDGAFPVPVSRHTEVRRDDLPSDSGLAILAESPESGLCLVEERRLGATYMFNHLEYDSETLGDEYLRDIEAGKDVKVPGNYYPADDPFQPPINGWRRYGHLLFRNWIEEIHEAIMARAEVEQSLQWLFSSHPRPSIVGDVGSDFLICAANRPSTLVEVLRKLAQFDHSPRALKVHRRDAATVLIVLRLGSSDAATAERISRALLAMDGFRSVAYRNTKGSGGIFVEQATRSPLAGGRESQAQIAGSAVLDIDWDRRGVA